MSICLSLQNDSGWKTFLTHSERKRFMVGTIIFDFIWYVSFSCTVLAFLMRKMLVFTFLSLFRYEIIKTLMFYKFFIFFFLCSTISLFFFGPMNHFYFFWFWFLFYLLNNSTKTILLFILHYSFRSFNSSSLWIFKNNILLLLIFIFIIIFIFFNRLKFFGRKW